MLPYSDQPPIQSPPKPRRCGARAATITMPVSQGSSSSTKTTSAPKPEAGE